MACYKVTPARHFSLCLGAGERGQGRAQFHGVFKAGALRKCAVMHLEFSSLLRSCLVAPSMLRPSVLARAGRKVTFGTREGLPNNKALARAGKYP